MNGLQIDHAFYGPRIDGDWINVKAPLYACSLDNAPRHTFIIPRSYDRGNTVHYYGSSNYAQDEADYIRNMLQEATVEEVTLVVMPAEYYPDEVDEPLDDWTRTSLIKAVAFYALCGAAKVNVVNYTINWEKDAVFLAEIDKLLRHCATHEAKRDNIPTLIDAMPRIHSISFDTWLYTADARFALGEDLYGAVKAYWADMSEYGRIWKSHGRLGPLEWLGWRTIEVEDFDY